MQDIGWLSRTELLIGKENLNKLINSHVLVVGMGGVGSFRCGIHMPFGCGRDDHS